MKFSSDPNCPLFGFETTKKLAGQLSKNCGWLVEEFDKVHFYLCSDKKGTWQDRVRQSVEAAKCVADKEKAENELIHI